MNGIIIISATSCFNFLLNYSLHYCEEDHDAILIPFFILKTNKLKKNSSTQTDTGSDQKEGIKALSQPEIFSKKKKKRALPC